MEKVYKITETQLNALATTFGNASKEAERAWLSAIGWIKENGELGYQENSAPYQSPNTTTSREHSDKWGRYS